MPDRATFCVVYRFRIRAGTEDAFVEAWSRLTRLIRDERGGLGSRLHRSDDGDWVAYAQWPDRATWERSSALGTPDADASRVLAASIETRLPPLLLDPRADLLTPCPAAPSG